VLGRAEGIDAYQDVSTVIVHPRTMRRHQIEAGEVHGTLTEGDIDLLGEAHHRGPVLIAWDAARRDARHPERGRNVVLHELAHKLDMLDLLVDGTPPLPDAVAHHRWVEVCTREFELLRAGQGGHLLDPYGATDVGEFFAVATEAFFCLPGELAHHKPDLYGVLRDFYGQDPAHRPHHRQHPWS
jgi:Mlc titration factor MtfA (ptsG expression regulator)